LHGEIEKGIKEMRDKKDRGEDEVPVEVSKLLGKDCLRLLTQLLKTYTKLESSPKI
jgi:hypothetical protein